MHVAFEGTLVKVATRRAKKDKDGVVTEEPGISVTVDLPVSVLSVSQLGTLLRAMDREVSVDLSDGQTEFGVGSDGRELLVAERR